MIENLICQKKIVYKKKNYSNVLMITIRNIILILQKIIVVKNTICSGISIQLMLNLFTCSGLFVLFLFF
ncbi:hypothetical protein BY996DRAFT_7303887 [Phakopsora pachyrhizi]|nr:hypothetical protein BY996DRAFT_8144505 [Phakopsora pachyrhizi]KAI8451401.1 hypothetical protein BY996DRAFT_7303887 [Phakopsora pachyrhizi]